MKCLKLTTVLLLILATSNFAQEIVGKIFSQKDATTLFGPVTFERTIPVSNIQQNLNISKDYLLFGFDVDRVVILIDKKVSTTNAVEAGVSPKVLYAFSKSKVHEFLATSPKSKNIKVQMRGDVLCLDNGISVLEFAQPCPPYCFLY